MQHRQFYRFGQFSLDATAKVLLRDGEVVRLPRKAVETLLVLIRSHDTVLTKEELIETIWPERVVEEANLAQNVAVLRKALAVDRGQPGAIETFAGRGYRILGPVTIFAETPVPEPEPPAPLVFLNSEQQTIVPAVTAPQRRPGRHPSPILGMWLAAALGLVLFGTWIGSLVRKNTGPKTYRRHPVARLGGREYQPAVSPDGTQVAFVWQRDGKATAKIWLAAAGGQNPRLITEGPGEYLSPAWSPDGRSLACLHFVNGTGEIQILPVAGGAPRHVVDVYPTRYGLVYHHLDWSPDGKLIAFDDATAEDEPFTLFSVSLESGVRRRLTVPTSITIGDVEPRFSPDGRLLSFLRARDRLRQGLFVLDLAAGTELRVIPDSESISGQDWTGDRQALVFGSNRSGDFRLWRLNPNKLENAAAVPTTVYGDFPIQISTAKRSPVLVYSILQQDFNIWKLNLDPKADPDTRWSQLVASSAEDASPVVSPDGSQICFRSDRSGEEQLWTANIDGSNPQQITRGELRPSLGNWSSDGRSIVFHSARNAHVQIARRGADGAWTHRDTGFAGVHPVFAPDGRYIYAGGSSSLRRIPIAGGEPEVLANEAALSLVVTADGRSLYYVRDPASTALWRFDLQTRQDTQVLDGLVPYCSSCWALAEGGIYYLGQDRQSRTEQVLYFKNWSSGQLRAVARYPEPVNPIGSGPFSLLPDGKSLVCVRNERTNTDVVQIDQFP